MRLPSFRGTACPHAQGDEVFALFRGAALLTAMVGAVCAQSNPPRFTPEEQIARGQRSGCNNRTVVLALREQVSCSFTKFMSVGVRVETRIQIVIRLWAWRLAIINGRWHTLSFCAFLSHQYNSNFLVNSYSLGRAAIPVLALAVGCLAHAVPLTGSIIFFGSATLNNTAPHLATAVTSWSNPITVGGSTIPGTGATATFVAPWQFNLLAPIPNFWTSGTTSFTLNASSITSQGIDGLGQGYVVVGGHGVLTAPNFEPTFATFNFTSQDPDLTSGAGTQTGLFSFSGSGLAFPDGNPGPGLGVPDGGTTAAFFGMTLIGIALLKRRFKAGAR